MIDHLASTTAEGQGKCQKLTGQDIVLASPGEPELKADRKHSTGGQAHNRLPRISSLLSRFPNSGD